MSWKAITLTCFTMRNGPSFWWSNFFDGLVVLMCYCWSQTWSPTFQLGCFFQCSSTLFLYRFCVFSRLNISWIWAYSQLGYHFFNTRLKDLAYDDFISLMALLLLKPGPQPLSWLFFSMCMNILFISPLCLFKVKYKLNLNKVNIYCFIFLEIKCIIWMLKWFFGMEIF